MCVSGQILPNFLPGVAQHILTILTVICFRPIVWTPIGESSVFRPPPVRVRGLAAQVFSDVWACDRWPTQANRRPGKRVDHDAVG
jgi:hypothetical protein